MKLNIPVTNREIEMRNDIVLVSKTDLKGRITECNEAFIEISGYSRGELIGQAHNLVRHPDMPPAAFKQMWQTLHQGRPWTGLVKNRAKNGDHYWVCANVVPITENKRVVGYMSARSKPTRSQITNAEQLYKAVNCGQATLDGSLPARLAHRLRDLDARKILLTQMPVSAMLSIIGAALLNAGSNTSGFALIAAAIVISLGLGAFALNQSRRAINLAADKLMLLAEGDYFNWIESTGSGDELKIREAVKCAQVKLGCDMQEQIDTASRSLRLKTALDNVHANVMVADAHHNIIYINESLRTTFTKVQHEIRADLPNFDVNQLVGSNIDTFHHHPEHQRTTLAALHEPLNARIKLGNQSFKFSSAPVIDEHHRRIGTVMEWENSTAQLEMEDEVENMVAEAALGNLAQRLSLADKTGFYLTLGERINAMMDAVQDVIQEVNAALSALSTGNLGQTIEKDYSGAFEELKFNINATVSNLTRVISNIQDSADQVDSGAQEIAHSNGNLRERTDASAISLEESATSLEEISSTLKANAEQTRLAIASAEKANSRAAHGGTVLNQTSDAMKAIHDASGLIQNIIKVIDDIAFQTNLLALNASVEAAHAGDNGQGFAVVATEVRSLAQRSAIAAGEIKTLISNSVERVDEGQRLVKESTLALEEIIQSVQEVSEFIRQISTASIEQATQIQQINGAMSHLESGTQQNGNMVEATALASSKLQDQANNLKQLTGFFHTGTPRTAKREPAPKRPLLMPS